MYALSIYIYILYTCTVCIHKYIYIYTRSFIHVCINFHGVYAKYIYIYTIIYTCICIRVHLYMYVCMHAKCVYIS